MQTGGKNKQLPHGFCGAARLDPSYKPENQAEAPGARSSWSCAACDTGPSRRGGTCAPYTFHLHLRLRPPGRCPMRRDGLFADIRAQDRAQGAGIVQDRRRASSPSTRRRGRASAMKPASGDPLLVAS